MSLAAAGPYRTVKYSLKFIVVGQQRNVHPRISLPFNLQFTGAGSAYISRGKVAS